MSVDRTPVSNPAELGFNARLDSATTLSIGGPNGYQAKARLVRGDLDGHLGTGFLALSRPGGKTGVFRTSAWKVEVPRWSHRNPRTGTLNPEARYDTTGENRRVLEIKGPEVGVVVFDRPIPKQLSLALQMVFQGASFPRHMIGSRKEGFT